MLALVQVPRREKEKENYVSVYWNKHIGAKVQWMRYIAMTTEGWSTRVVQS